MKKLVIVALAVFLALPVLSHAGSVQTRMWDMTIQGYIAGVVQISDQDDAAVWGAPYVPARRTGTAEVQGNEWGNTAVNSDVRVGMLIKGPETWGAKSSAYLEWDFSGGNVTVPAGGGSNGTAKLRHAWLRWDWAKDAILFGNAGSLYRDFGVGLPPGVGSVIAEPVLWGGPRDFQLRWIHKWTKEITTSFAAVYGGGEGWPRTGTANDYTRETLPMLVGHFKYASDSCGKVGPLNMVFGGSAIIAQRSVSRDTGVAGHNRYSKSHGYGWLANAVAQIPIIPEKNNNKAGGLVFNAYAEVSQNLPQSLNMGSEAHYRSIYASAIGPVFASADDASYPRGYLIQGTLNLWYTNTVFSTFTYALNRYQYSRAYLGNGTGEVARKQYFLVTLMYQPNPSLVTGIEYARYVADYSYRAAGIPASKKWGVANAVRFGAYYYF